MNNVLHYGTVTVRLKAILQKLMQEKLFAPFRLVGGTNLSLRYGHRISVDIDLFTDEDYGSLDFRLFEEYLKANFLYYDCNDDTSIVGFGRSYYIGETGDDCVKLDLMYTDPFLDEAELIDGVRMASVRDMVAMKMNAICAGGRKKDFWDLHMLLEHFSLEEMFDLHRRRHPWEHDRDEMKTYLTDFSEVDEQPDPICMQNKDWDDIKLDFIDVIQKLHD